MTRTDGRAEAAPGAWHDVIIVGAGPVGLLLAGELRLGGANVLILERLTVPTSESRASTLHARTMEFLDQRGLLDRFGEPVREPTGHFGGVRLDFSEVLSPYSGLWKVPQTRTEEVLQAWALHRGAALRRGYEVCELVDHPTEVEVGAVGPAGPVRLRASFVVGCDGEQSTVRRLAGVPLAGREMTRELLRADVAGIDLPNRRFERLTGGVAVAARRGDGVTRVMVHEYGTAPVTRPAAPQFTEIVEAWARVTGENISGGRPLWTGAFGDACRQATHYRSGRILLAGDAAHVQLPAGGQALNLGLQDAANLGWKLAAAACGRAPRGLLDSYHGERHPVGASVLTNVAAQASLLLGGAEVEAVRQVFGELMGYEPVRDRLATAISGLDIRYGGANGHPLVGRRLPPCTLLTSRTAVSSAALLRSGHGLLLNLSDPAELGHRTAATGWEPRIVRIRASAPAGGPLDGLATVLVRPDGYVAEATSVDDVPEAALRRWFGDPMSSRHPTRSVATP